MLKTVQELSDHELLDLARLVSEAQAAPNNLMFLVNLASELKHRHFYATEDFILHLAGELITK